MERFKAVEKAMKTKAYSKEGLSAATKLDPKEQAKVEAGEFLGSQVDELEQQIETLEAEGEAIQATIKKGKAHGAKADRMAEIERIIERHKWHQAKLELIRRSLENGGVEPEQVTELEESIKYYVTDNQNDDFMEDDTMYDDLKLTEDEDAFGMNPDTDKVSSQDTQSIQDDVIELDARSNSIASGKVRAGPEAAASTGRRPSTQLKSPLPTLATLHTPLPTIGNGAATSASMKPASIPSRPAGEGLKYASAAAAAAASDRGSLGIAPLPPPPGMAVAAPIGIPTLPSTQQARTSVSATSSPNMVSAQPAAQPQLVEKPPASIPPAKAEKSSRAAGKAPAPPTPAPEPSEPSKGNSHPARAHTWSLTWHAHYVAAPHTNGLTNGTKPATAPIVEEEPEESIYHLPASLQDLVDSFEITKKRPAPANSTATLRMLANSQATSPDALDAEAPRPYHPDVKFQSSSGYPQEPLNILEDPRLYNRIDPDTLFYVFYYKQGTYQQYLAAKALKDMSWRFHKQYQTWFQRHEEPKTITEEYEQGTYRFFDYESTW